MRNRKLIGLTATVLLHLSLLFFLLPSKPNTTDIPPPPAEHKPLMVKLLPKADEPIHDETLKGNDEAFSYPVHEKICNGKDKSYKGIGLIFSPGSNTVTDVPDYYPAYKAGVRVGDFIVNPYESIVNDHIELELRRGYTYMHFRIKTDNICFNAS